MAEEIWDRMDTYITETLVGEDEALEAATKVTAEAGLPPIAVAPNQGKLLHFLAVLCGARNILEVGTLGGYSTIWLARALGSGGRLLTLEAEPRHAEVARADIERAGVAHLVEILLGPAIETLPKLAAASPDPFDFVFIDADKPSTPDYLRWAIDLTRSGGVIVIDNVVRNGAVSDPSSTDPGILGIRAANEILASDPRVTATAIQTVGIKGYDGLAVALVT